MLKQATILIVDDDLQIRELLRDILEMTAFHVIEAESGQAALTRLSQTHVDLALLDMQLPDTFGIELFKIIQAQYPDLPCLFVSGMDQETDVVLGLELGAEDYITKPFRPRELITRIKKVLARRPVPRLQEKSPESQPGHVLSCGALSIDPQRRQIVWESQAIETTKTEFDLLYLFLKHPEQVLTRAQILEHLWSHDLEISERIVDTHIKHLRAKFTCHPPFIKTVRGVGYCFMPLLAVSTQTP